MTLDEWLYSGNFTVLNLPIDEETKKRINEAKQWMRDFAFKQGDIHYFSLSFQSGDTIEATASVLPLPEEEKAVVPYDQ